MQPIAVPRQHFSHVHIDIVGPSPVTASSHLYLLTMVDRTTRWLEATPLASIEAASCAHAFIDT